MARTEAAEAGVASASPAQRALMRLREKLRGLEDGTVLNVAGHVRRGRLRGVCRPDVRSLTPAVHVGGGGGTRGVQVNYTITQATSVDNLCVMYSGWRPWL